MRIHEKKEEESIFFLNVHHILVSNSGKRSGTHKEIISWVILKLLNGFLKQHYQYPLLADMKLEIKDG